MEGGGSPIKDPTYFRIYLDNGLDHLMTVKKVYVEFNGEKGTLS